MVLGMLFGFLLFPRSRLPRILAAIALAGVASDVSRIMLIVG